jgi:hypothetical protein
VGHDSRLSLEILRTAVLDSGRQLIRFETGDGLKAVFARMVGDHLSAVFGPDTRALLHQSKQGRGLLPLREFRFIHLLSLICSIVYCFWFFIRRRRQMTEQLRAFHLFVPSAIVCCGVMTGALSGP